VLTRGSGPREPGQLTKSEGSYRQSIGVARFEKILNIAREELQAENREATEDELEETFLALAGF
jgi:hypothetical protein